MSVTESLPKFGADDPSQSPDVTISGLAASHNTLGVPNEEFELYDSEAGNANGPVALLESTAPAEVLPYEPRHARKDGGAAPRLNPTAETGTESASVRARRAWSRPRHGETLDGLLGQVAAEVDRLSAAGANRTQQATEPPATRPGKPLREPRGYVEPSGLVRRTTTGLLPADRPDRGDVQTPVLNGLRRREPMSLGRVAAQLFQLRRNYVVPGEEPAGYVPQVDPAAVEPTLQPAPLPPADGGDKRNPVSLAELGPGHETTRAEFFHRATANSTLGQAAIGTAAPEQPVAWPTIEPA